MGRMGHGQLPVRAAGVIGWALAFGLVVDHVTNGPPGLGAALAAWVAALGVTLTARPRPVALVFLAAALVPMCFVVLRASPVLVGLDLGAGVGLFALAGAFAREGDPLRTGVRAYVARGLSWVASFGTVAAFAARPLTRLVPASGRVPSAVPRALLISLPVGLAFALLLGSADAVFAELLRAPFEHVHLDELPRHLVVIGAAGTAFLTIALRATSPVVPERGARPIEGGGLRPADWISLLATVDVVFALFVGVQLVTFFGGRRHVLAETGLTFAEYARSGFWQMLAASTLTGLVIAAAWIGGRPAGGARRWFAVLATALIALSLVVLASAFHRLVLYETEFGYTWPRLIPHVAILLTGALLACGIVAIATGRTRWLASAALTLGFLALIGLNLLDPEAFIADRNIARVERGHDLDPRELSSLSADAVPAVVAAIPGLDPSIRPVIERDLSCIREELRRDVERFGWRSFNASRDIALERLNPLDLPPC